MATEDDKINTGALATVVAVGALGMIGVSLAVNALVRHEVGSIGAERDATGEVAYHSMRDAQLKKLSGPTDWSDRAKGQVSIPIDRAMGLVLADLKRTPWSASPWPSPDAGAPQAVDPTQPDAGADAGAADAGAPEGDKAATATDAGPAPEPPAGSALSPSTPAPPTSANPAAAPSPSAPPKPRTPVPATTPGAPSPTVPPAAP